MTALQAYLNHVASFAQPPNPLDGIGDENQVAMARAQTRSLLRHFLSGSAMT